MNVAKPNLTRRSTLVVAVTTAVVLGVAGWAIADGEIPILSSSTSDTTAPPTSSSTTLAATPGNGTDNVAVASNSTDGRTVIAISLKIVQTDAATVDPTNAAVAVASCTDCQTVAIALEGVLVAGAPTTFDPTNIALAINENCTNCQTLASAYQYVVQNDTKVRITGAGRQEIAAVRKDLESLRNSGLDILAIQQRVNAAAGRLYTVLQNDVVPVGKPRLSESSSTSTTAPSSASTSSTSTTISTLAPVSTTSTTVSPSTTTVIPSTTTTAPVAP